MSSPVTIYTDGACRGNPGSGGWGVLIIENNNEITLFGGKKNTTNNQMEMTAAIEGLSYFEERTDIEIYTDSNYLKDGIESWIHSWKKNGWKTASKKPVKNKELWMKVDKLNQFHNVSWSWVKGHSGNRENDIADMLANKGIDEI